MKLTAIFEPASEGGYTCFVEEMDALRSVLDVQRHFAEENPAPGALREPIELAEA